MTLRLCMLQVYAMPRRVVYLGGLSSGIFFRPDRFWLTAGTVIALGCSYHFTNIYFHSTSTQRLNNLLRLSCLNVWFRIGNLKLCKLRSCSLIFSNRIDILLAATLLVGLYFILFKLFVNIDINRRTLIWCIETQFILHAFKVILNLILCVFR